MLRFGNVFKLSKTAWGSTCRLSSCPKRALHTPRPTTLPLNSKTARRRLDTPLSDTVQCHASLERERSQHHLRAIGIDRFFLRDSCQCSRCVNASTQQKLFETSQIPLDLSIKNHKWNANGSLEIWWENDMPRFEAHRSTFSSEFLQRAQTIKGRVAGSGNSWKHVSWDRRTVEQKVDALTFEYEDYMRHNRILRDLVFRLHEFGLAFVKDVPNNEDAITGLAQRIGPLKETFYGETWDVKSKASPINVAYTSADLDFHMDLLYLADPPGVQILHCIKPSTNGGESRFADGVRAFDRFQDQHPDLVHALVGFPVTYRYKNDGRWFQKTRNFLEGGTLVRHQGGPLTLKRYRYPLDYECLNWSPPFQGPLEQVDTANETDNPIAIKTYVEAARAFKKLLAEEGAVYETKMDAGTCAIFNNRRVLHARRPFSSDGGERWLKGCYIDGDYLRDKYRVLSETND